MGFNGSGIHNRVHDWTQDLTNSIPVTASRMDADSDDFSLSLSNTICRDGQSTTTARIPFAQGVSTAGGSTSLVAYGQTNDLNTGMYFPATDQWGLVAGGTATLTSTAIKLTATVAVDFTGAIAPTSSDGAALGSTTQMWSDLFLASGAFINFNNGDATVEHIASSIIRINASNSVAFNSPSVRPNANDGAALGAATVSWSDLFLASGGVINWNNGDVTATHSANSLAFAGALSGYSFDAAVSVAGAVTASTQLSGATAAGNMIATQSEQETGLVTDKIVTPGRQHYHPSAAKAWVKFAGATGAIEASHNVSGVSRGAAGAYSVSFSTALSSANFVVSGNCVTVGVFTLNVNSPTTGGFNVITHQSGVAADPTSVMLVIYGDL